MNLSFFPLSNQPAHVLGLPSDSKALQVILFRILFLDIFMEVLPLGLERPSSYPCKTPQSKGIVY